MAALTQSQINESVEWAKANLTGHVTDEAGNYAGECLSLNRREFIHRSGIPNAPASPDGWGTGWMQRPGALVDFFNPPVPYNPNADYPKGSYAFNVPSHHIMIYDHREGTSAAVFEQNADPDGDVAHMALRAGSRISHIMTPIIAPDIPYVQNDIPDKQIRVNKNTHRWNMLQPNFEAMNDNPISDVAEGSITTVKAIAHHVNGNSYYLEQPTDTTGLNVFDCDDYTAPPPPPVPVPAAHPNYTFEKLPNPLNVQVKPNMNLWDLNYFKDDYSDAVAISALSTDPANPTIFEAYGKATKNDNPAHPVYFMSKESFGDADTTGEPAYWRGVNTVDLGPAPVAAVTPAVSTPVTEPIPEVATPVETPAEDSGEKIPVTVNHPNPDAWKTSFKTNESGEYKAVTSVTVHDLDGKVADLQLPKGAVVKIAGKFTGPDNVEYWRSEKSAARVDPKTLQPKDEDWRGIPVNDENGNEVLEEDFSLAGYIDDGITSFENIMHRDGKNIRRSLLKASATAHADASWLAGRLKKRSK